VIKTGFQTSKLFRNWPSLLVWPALVAMTAVIGGSFWIRSVEAQQNTQPAFHDYSNWPPINPLANRTADANRILEDSMRVQESQKHQRELILQRHKEMKSDTAKLLALVMELKSKSDTPNRSFTVDDLAKTDKIEQLAHNVKASMAGTN
jgi:hypothetical protein